MFVGKSPEERELLGEEMGIPVDLLFSKKKRKWAWKAIKRPFTNLFGKRRRRAKKI